MEVIETDAGDHECPFNDFKPCRGARCMAWQWESRPYERCETDNLAETDEGPRPVGVPNMPDGDGWVMDGAPFSKGYHRSEKDKLPKATGQRWVRPVARSSGMCGRVNTSPYW